MKIMRKNIIGFITGGIIFGSIGITVASQILATQVSYTNEKSESNVTSVDGALTELYGLAEECQSSSSSGSSITYYGKDAVAVYLDPTGNKNDCSSSNFKSDTETKEGCMRFYVYAADSEYKYAILDHNTTAKVSSGFYAAQSQVKEDTSNWDPNLQARNISAMEIYKITESTNGKTNWQLEEFWFPFNHLDGSSYGQGYGYVWLFDRTKNCTSQGCTTDDSSTEGYWTSDARRDSSQAWCVDFAGRLDNKAVSYSTCGVRPVIRISK